MLYIVKNVTKGTTLGDSIFVAGSSGERRAGLLRRQSLAKGSGIWIAPSEAVHTFFMKFAIDVLHLDGEHRVVKIAPCLKPWRMSACVRGKSVLELPAGTVERAQTASGDRLVFEQRQK